MSGSEEVQVWISPLYRLTDFPKAMSRDDKIDVFADRVRGWQLNIAQQCADRVKHSGYGVLHIVTSYFEMIAKFRDGCTREREPKRYFKKGVYLVFPELREYGKLGDALLTKLYDELRCGLYHSGSAGPGVWLSCDFDQSISMRVSDKAVVINPHRLVPSLRKHFESYIRELRDVHNEDLRQKFERRFDWQRK